MTENIIKQLEFNIAYAKKLVDDLTDLQMMTSPACGLENHPSFTLGHLVTAKALMTEDLGGKRDIPEGWAELFLRKGPGDPRLPTPNSSSYPGKHQLLDELVRQNELLISAIKNTGEEKFAGQLEWRFSKLLPTLFDLTLFMCVNHEAMHLGQLAAWRRAMKLPSALAAI